MLQCGRETLRLTATVWTGDTKTDCYSVDGRHEDCMLQCGREALRLTATLWTGGTKTDCYSVDGRH